MLRLNLGCGPVQPRGWVNIDGSHRARLASYLPWLDRLLVRLRVLPPTEFGPNTTPLDLRRPLPFADGSVGVIYAGQLWEHLELVEGERLARECCRVLAPGGVLRVCVPDGVAFWRRYLELAEESLARPRPFRSAEPLRRHVAMYFREVCTRRPGLRYMGHKHKWQYDEVQLVEQLESAGFAHVRRMPFHVSHIPDVAAVEHHDLLIVEGVKPPAHAPVAGAHRPAQRREQARVRLEV